MADLTLKNFSEIYVENAFLVAARSGQSPDDFYTELFSRISGETGLSEKNIVYMHHAFHWELFLNPYSPFQLIDPNGFKGSPIVDIKKDHVEKSTLVSILFAKHGTMLRERFDNLMKKKN